MATLPITRMTLYKHGIGFYERRAEIDGEEVELPFRTEEMDDVLKSLTVIDRGKGQVLGLEYPTPQNKLKQLNGCSIQINNKRSMRDLLISLKGRRVRLLMGEIMRVSNYPNQAQYIIGKLLGIDQADGEQPLEKTLITIMRENTSQVYAIELGRLAGVDIIDEKGADDLRLYLETAIQQADFCAVKIRLSPGEHDLSISYIAPAPVWRVSYRLVADTNPKAGATRAMLLGLSIFDNPIEEDLNNISVSFVSGMPVSFLYNLYSPFMPERTYLKEESRVLDKPAFIRRPSDKSFTSNGNIPAMISESDISLNDKSVTFKEGVEEAMLSITHGKDLGELFQYVVNTPVSVGRGQSASVPILSANLGYRKELLYNESNFSNHPIAIIRFKNQTNLVLEHGPVTVIEDGQYIGEAILPFTPKDGEVILPFAVELGVNVTVESSHKVETQGLGVKDGFLIFVEWQTIQTVYRIINHTSKEMSILIEHPRSGGYELFETLSPKERTLDHYRFEVLSPIDTERKLKVLERRLISRHAVIHDQSLDGLRKYMEQGLLDKHMYERLVDIFTIWSKISQHETEINIITQDRGDIYKVQEQMRRNLNVLSKDGIEGEMRVEYINKMKLSEEKLGHLSYHESEHKTEIEQLKQEVDTLIHELESID